MMEMIKIANTIEIKMHKLFPSIEGMVYLEIHNKSYPCVDCRELIKKTKDIKDYKKLEREVQELKKEITDWKLIKTHWEYENKLKSEEVKKLQKENEKFKNKLKYYLEPSDYKATIK